MLSCCSGHSWRCLWFVQYPAPGWLPCTGRGVSAPMLWEIEVLLVPSTRMYEPGKVINTHACCCVIKRLVGTKLIRQINRRHESDSFAFFLPPPAIHLLVPSMANRSLCGTLRFTSFVSGDNFPGPERMGPFMPHRRAILLYPNTVV